MDTQSETVGEIVNGTDLAPEVKKIESNERVRIADPLVLLVDEVANTKRQPGAVGTVIGFIGADVRETHLVRHEDGTLAKYAFDELEVIVPPMIEVKRFALFTTDMPWPRPTDRAFSVDVPAPAILKGVTAFMVRVPEAQGPVPFLRFIFVGSPDAPEVPVRFLLALEGDAVNFRVDIPEEKWPTLVEVATSPVNGQSLAVWRARPDYEIPGAPTVSVKAQVQVIAQPDAPPE